MELRLAAARIPAPGTQTQITAHVAAAAKSVRVFQRQYIGQRDQRSHTFHLLEQADLGILFLSDLFDRPVVCGDPLVQRFDLPQQRFQGGSQFHAQARCEIRAHLLCATFAQPFTVGLGQPSCGIDQSRACPTSAARARITVR
jgi:hypothetical protein